MPPAPGLVLAGTYRLTRKIGAGGMGEVWEAQHARLAGRYAVKLLLPEALAHKDAMERFRREAEVTSALQHPHIVQILDFNQTPDGIPYLVMELLRGQDLSTLLERQRRLPLPRALAIVRHVASALQAAHTAGIVHRDLKPSNLFLVPVDGPEPDFVKVLDFGISKIRAATRSLTGTMVMGTPEYMSPEQARGRTPEIDARTDQFALGAILYEMLAGQTAFSGEDPMATLYQVINHEPQALPLDVPAPVTAVVKRAMEKDRTKRFGTVAELVTALDTGMTPRPRKATPPPTIRGFSGALPEPLPRKVQPVSDDEPTETDGRRRFGHPDPSQVATAILRPGAAPAPARPRARRKIGTTTAARFMTLVRDIRRTRRSLAIAVIVAALGLGGAIAAGVTFSVRGRSDSSVLNPPRIFLTAPAGTVPTPAPAPAKSVAATTPAAPAPAPPVGQVPTQIPTAAAPAPPASTPTPPPAPASRPKPSRPAHTKAHAKTARQPRRDEPVAGEETAPSPKPQKRSGSKKEDGWVDPFAQ